MEDSDFNKPVAIENFLLNKIADCSRMESVAVGYIRIVHDPINITQEDAYTLLMHIRYTNSLLTQREQELHQILMEKYYDRS